MSAIKFQKRYEQAIIKTAIGIYIIESAGESLSHSEYTVRDNIQSLCNLLADNIGVSRETVINDATHAYAQLPVQYIHELHESGIIEEMIKELFRLKILSYY